MFVGRLIILMTGLIVPCIGQTPAATVSFRFSDSFGRPVSAAQVSLKSDDGVVKRFTAEERGMDIKLLAGSYQMTVAVIGFSTSRRDIYVEEGTDIVVSQGLCVAQIGDPSSRPHFILNGLIETKDPANTEIRIWGVFNLDQVVVKIQPSGAFSARLTCEGEYVVASVASGRIVETRLVTVRTNNPPLILKGRRP